MPTLVPGSGSAKTTELWAYARDDRTFGGSGPLMVAYRSKDSRSAECAARRLNGYRGILQVDGYAAYNKLARPDRANDGITLAGCWSHNRRKFYELHVAGSSKVTITTVERMAKLWQVEKIGRGRSPRRTRYRALASLRGVVADIFDRWRHTLRRIPGKSKLAQAIRYAVSRRSLFERFLTDGALSSTPT
ncbi:hypothetical protein ABIF86_000381 [Bradyrhizobium japonicum]